MKNLKLKIFSFLLLLCFSSTYSQYTEVINSNKPGFSESPYSVGTGVYQLESNIFYKNTGIEPTFTIPESFGVDLLFRTSFFLEKLEINAQASYQRDKVAFKNIFTSHYYTTGLSKFTIGAKYLIFQQEYEDKTKEVRSWKKRFAFDKKRLIPSVALYAGINTNFLGDYYKTESVSPKVGILLQNNLSSKFNVITNFYYDQIGTEFSEFSYIITGTYNFSDRWSSFLENQTVFKKYQNNTNIGTGLAYLYSKNLQINSSMRFLVEGQTTGVYAGFGVSYRINRHKDSYKELDENGREIKESPIKQYNKKQKGFFGRIFVFLQKKKRRKHQEQEVEKGKINPLNL